MDSIDRAGSIEKSNLAIDHPSSISSNSFLRGKCRASCCYYFYFFFFFKANRSLLISGRGEACVRCRVGTLLEMNFVWEEPWRDKVREEFLMDFFFFFKNSNLNLFDFALFGIVNYNFIIRKKNRGIERLICSPSFINSSK